MRVKNIMTSPVQTAQADMPVLEAAQLMKEKGIERLPVVDGEKLVGIVTKDRVLRASPSSATSLSLHELNYLYSKLTLREIMQKNVTAVGPEVTVEQAVRIAQENRVGCLPVMENGKVVGILTTNDFFYLVLNPILGIGVAGARIIVQNIPTPHMLSVAIECVAETGYTLTNATYLPSRRGNENDLLIHVDEDDATKLVECMKSKGLDAAARER